MRLRRMQGSLLPSLAALHSRGFLLEQRRLECLRRLEGAIQVLSVIAHVSIVFPTLQQVCLPLGTADCMH